MIEQAQQVVVADRVEVASEIVLYEEQTRVPVNETLKMLYRVAYLTVRAICKGVGTERVKILRHQTTIEPPRHRGVGDGRNRNCPCPT
jgi:hypothetical protein